MSGVSSFGVLATGSSLADPSFTPGPDSASLGPQADREPNMHTRHTTRVTRVSACDSMILDVAMTRHTTRDSQVVSVDAMVPEDMAPWCRPQRTNPGANPDQDADGFYLQWSGRPS